LVEVEGELEMSKELAAVQTVKARKVVAVAIAEVAALAVVARAQGKKAEVVDE
jgi:predicted ribosome-associated RNA-binding protein Tma20